LAADGRGASSSAREHAVAVVPDSVAYEKFPLALADHCSLPAVAFLCPAVAQIAYRSSKSGGRVPGPYPADSLTRHTNHKESSVYRGFSHYSAMEIKPKNYQVSLESFACCSWLGYWYPVFRYLNFRVYVYSVN
jgi:hypothetical protein